MIEALERPTNLWSTMWFNNGGDITYKNYDNNRVLLKKHLNFIKSLPKYLFYPEDNLLITHAPFVDYYKLYKDLELKKNKDILDNTKLNKLEELITWNRKFPKNKSSICNIFGHNIITYFYKDLNEDVITEEGIIIDKELNYVALDTGAFISKNTKFTGKLSCIEYPSMKIYQQTNIDL